MEKKRSAADVDHTHATTDVTTFTAHESDAKQMTIALKQSGARQYPRTQMIWKKDNLEPKTLAFTVTMPPPSHTMKNTPQNTIPC